MLAWAEKKRADGKGLIKVRELTTWKQEIYNPEI